MYTSDGEYLHGSHESESGIIDDDRVEESFYI